MFLSVNIHHFVNNIGPCYFTVAPVWPKSYHTIGPKSTFLCHLVHHRTLSKILSNTFTLPQFPLLCYMFDDLFVWMGKISGTTIKHSYSFTHAMPALIIGVAKPGQLPRYHQSLPQYQQATWIFKNY